MLMIDDDDLTKESNGLSDLLQATRANVAESMAAMGATQRQIAAALGVKSAAVADKALRGRKYQLQRWTRLHEARAAEFSSDLQRLAYLASSDKSDQAPNVAIEPRR